MPDPETLALARTILAQVRAGARVRALARQYGWSLRQAHRVVDRARQIIALTPQIPGRDARGRFTRQGD